MAQDPLDEQRKYLADVKPEDLPKDFPFLPPPDPGQGQSVGAPPDTASAAASGGLTASDASSEGTSIIPLINEIKEDLKTLKDHIINAFPAP